MVVCILKVKISPIKKHSFTPRIHTWKLNNPEIANQFYVDFNLKVANATTNSDDCVESAWALHKKPLYEDAVMTFGEAIIHHLRLSYRSRRKEDVPAFPLKQLRCTDYICR